MNIVLTLVMVVQVLCAIGVIVLVLLQHGKGADMGAAFGSGASGSLFGATGSANFLSRTTAALATVFFVCTLALSFLSSRDTVQSAPRSVMEQMGKTPSGDGIPGGAPAGGQTAPAASGAAPAAGSADPAASQNPAKPAPGNEIPK